MPNTIIFNSSYPDITISDQLAERAEPLIPCLTQTLAKGPAQHVGGIAPKYLRKGKGCKVTDVDGNEYLDYTMGVGPLSLGYAHPVVDEAIRKQLEDGITFSLMHPLEVEVAELITRYVPNAEMVRFSKTGADVTSAAIRLARAYTKKQKVLCCGYHGWHDWYISTTDRNAGIPDCVENLTYTFNYNDLNSLIDSIDEDTAAVILEPFVFQSPDEKFLTELRSICSHYNIVLIFDEMWTGFRVSMGGAQEYFGIQADLACFSKAVANGMPLSILTGRKDIMKLLEKEVFFFTTFGGEALSLAAAKATIEFMAEHDVQRHLADIGKLLKDGYNELIEKHDFSASACIGYDCRTMVTFTTPGIDPLLLKSLMQQELIKRGILWAGSHNISYSHSVEDIEYTLEAYDEVIPLVRKAWKTGTVEGKLLGTPVAPVFRKTSNFNTKPKMAAR